MESVTLTFSANFVSAFLDAACVSGTVRNRLLRATGISPEVVGTPAARVTHFQFAALFRNVAQHLDDEMPGLLSRPVRVGMMKFVLLGVIDAPTLERALYRYTQISRLVNHDYEIVLGKEGKEAKLTIVLQGSNRSAYKTMGVEFTLKVFHGLASWLLGKPLRLHRVNFAFALPSYAEDLKIIFPAALAFDQPHSELIFPASLLESRITRTRPEMQMFLKNQPYDWLTFPAAGQPLASRIRTHLLSRSPCFPSLEEVSSSLNLSPRTLGRRLANEGRSFQEVKDELRRDLAVDRLSHSSISVAQIAADLGFKETASFYRAFRTWTGVTPSAYRGGEASLPLHQSTRPVSRQRGPAQSAVHCQA